MTKNLDNEGLRSIVDNYDLFYIDIWGVVHNGVNIFKDSIKVLNEILKLKKDFVLLTNAPRPNENVKKFCEKLGMDKKLSNHIFTSGEAAKKYLKRIEELIGCPIILISTSPERSDTIYIKDPFNPS